MADKASTAREIFKFCPRCGIKEPKATDRSMSCTHCGYSLFVNIAVAVAVFVKDPKGRLLWTRRAKEPRKGKLALPGGFADPNESLEEAARRETREEVGLHLKDLRYLCSCPNLYEFAGVTYATVDTMFTAELLENEEAQALDEVTEIQWLHPSEVDVHEIAFPSLATGFKSLRDQRRC